MLFPVTFLQYSSVLAIELAVGWFRVAIMPDLQQPTRSFTARGRIFTSEDIDKIVRIVERSFEYGRTAISKQVCQALSWCQPNGRLKDMACREVLRKLETIGLIALPSPKGQGAVWNPPSPECDHDFDTTPVTAADLKSVQVRLVEDPGQILAWNALVGAYHYLHSSRIVGRQLKYVAYAGERLVACLGWGEAAWALKSRDGWIGWSSEDRACNRHLIVNNVRFLILPWIHVPNLASCLLAACSSRIVKDWFDKYGVRPVLLETFVDLAQFPGTCYRAANWTQIGVTAGYAKAGCSHHNSQTPKGIFVYPVHTRFKDMLKGSSNGKLHSNTR